MLDDKSSPVAFEDILNITNRSEQELRIILGELIKGKMIKEVEKESYAISE